MLPYVLTEELLCSNGFPRPHPEEKGVAIVHLPPGTVKKTPLSPNRKRVLRVCSRCNQGYSVNKNGFQIKDEQCVYHWGRMFQTRGRLLVVLWTVCNHAFKMSIGYFLLLVNPLAPALNCQVGAAEDWNFNEICTRKAMKCHFLNLTFGILSITLCDSCT